MDLNINIWKYLEIQYSEIYVNKWLYTAYKSKLINQQLWHCQPTFTHQLDIYETPKVFYITKCT